VLRFRLRGDWHVTLYDTLTGMIAPIECERRAGWTAVSRPFYDHDSLLLKFTAEPTGTPEAASALASVVSTDSVAEPGKALETGKAAVTAKRYPGRVPVTLEEPNVLLLDMAEYALDGEPYRPVEEILRLDNILRGELGWPKRMEAVAQPWVERDDSTPHTLALRFTFWSKLAVSGAKLALERPELAAIKLNGMAITAGTDGWYVDKCIRTVELPAITPGINVVEVTYQYGRKVDLECLYLIGDFGVEVAGTQATLTEPVRALAFGDITRQGLPFYGGNIVYHLEAETASEELTIAASCYRGHLLGVSVDGVDQGRIAFSPYRLTVRGLMPGTHRIDLRWFGNRINTFGQLHCVTREEGFWWGPNSWRTLGEEWSYEYRFWRQGILKSPEISG
jgi:hypothetical protein